MYEYITKGTCSSKINFNIEDGKLNSVKFEGGCNGNLKALGILLEDMNAVDAVILLKGLQCQKKDTSCADQLTKAIEQYM